MKKKYAITFLFFFSLAQVSKAQLYLPLSNYYNEEAVRINLSDSLEQSYRQSHQSFKPILDKKTNTQALYHTEEKRYYWITQKLFKENFLLFKGDQYWCAVDPILDLELGGDFSADSTSALYWNTRGIRVQAKFFDRVGFTTTFYETQALLPGYMQNYVNLHGEFIPNAAGTAYSQQNAVIPGYARTKQFKTNGYDFAFAEGSVSILATDWLNLHFGNGNQFIGDGYRSLLLSDFTTNYPFAKAEFNFFNERLQYIVMYAMHQNLYRLKENTTPEATYERKIGSYHYLDFAVTKNFTVGLFEANLWNRVDEFGTQKPDYLFLNPVIGVNPFVKKFDSEGYNGFFGLNTKLILNNLKLYGQLVLDKASIGGFQTGFKFYDLFINKLDVRVEYNHASQDMGQSENARLNYSSGNLPLAHPYANGFDEIIADLEYQYKRFFISNKLIYAQQAFSNTISSTNKILNAKNTLAENDIQWKHLLINQFEFGYRFNKNYNLQAIIGYIYRNETKEVNTPLTNYVYFGVRTQLKNKYLDF
jgi:hypothetical protein